MGEILKRTPLYEEYVEDGVKLIDFGGWAMPIQFTGIMEEHYAVRNDAGLFDVSHMGELLITGENATDWLNGLFTNDVSKAKVNQAQYNVVCNEIGGTLDDLIFFKLSEDSYLVTPNAGNTQKIKEWFEQHLVDGVEMNDLSAEYGLLALQGPKAAEILSKLTSASLDDLKPYHFLQEVEVAGQSNVLLARTGYTGEDGFELYIKWDQTKELWDAILKAGEGVVIPCGLGARDTLRLEAGLGLYGHELSEEISPLEAGLGFAVKTNKEVDFIGKDILKAQRENGVERINCGFELVGKGIAREGYDVLNQDGEIIGVVTSGTKSPTLGKSIGMMLIDPAYKAIDTPVQIQVRKRLVDAKIIRKPFYKK